MKSNHPRIAGITITFRSILQHIKNIDKRNMAYDNLTKQGKRMEQAWEVLKMILEGHIVITTGDYWDSGIVNIYETSATARSLQKKLCGVRTCSVCARGGLMLARLRLGNKLFKGNTYVDAVARGTEKNIDGFSLHSFIQLEKAYEGWNMPYYNYTSPYISGTEERLANLMCNILVNGDFNPADCTDYLILRKEKKV